MKIFTKRFNRTLSKLQDSFLTENRENKKMLDTYIKFAEGSVSEEELEIANSQLQQILKNLGLGILIVLPFSFTNAHVGETTAECIKFTEVKAR